MDSRLATLLATPRFPEAFRNDQIVKAIMTNPLAHAVMDIRIGDRITEVVSENEALKKAAADGDAEKEELKKKVTELEAKNKDLEKKIADLEKPAGGTSTTTPTGVTGAPAHSPSSPGAGPQGSGSPSGDGSAAAAFNQALVQAIAGPKFDDYWQGLSAEARAKAQALAKADVQGKKPKGNELNAIYAVIGREIYETKMRPALQTMVGDLAEAGTSAGGTGEGAQQSSVTPASSATGAAQQDQPAGQAGKK
jgi:hypothetical protein